MTAADLAPIATLEHAPADAAKGQARMAGDGRRKGEWRLDQLRVEYWMKLLDLRVGGREGAPTARFHAWKTGECDRGLAVSIALLGHIALVLFFWDGAGARPGSNAAEGGDGSTMAVEFVAIRPSVLTPSLAALAQSADVARNESAGAAPATAAAPVDSLPVPDGDELAANTKGAAAPNEHRPGPEAGMRASLPNDASSNAVPTATASGADGTAGKDDLAGRYIAAIKRSVAARWAVPTGGKTRGTCTLTIYQAAGGQVQSAVSGACELDETARRGLEAAALMAQPLPYQGFESVFREELVLEFDSI